MPTSCRRRGLIEAHRAVGLRLRRRTQLEIWTKLVLKPRRR
jgi:hypothetical protein